MRLFNKLKELDQENLISFHVPGHKYNTKVSDYYKEFTELLRADVTEIPGTDDLHDPSGAIEESQNFAASYFNVQKTFFLVNGTTCGIYAMVMAVTEPGDKIIVSRDCHRAVYDAMMLSRVQPIFVMPEIHQKTSIPLGLTYESVKDAIYKHKDAKAIVLTYPNYYGITCDIEPMIRLAHENNMVFLVDEAHGAHLHLNDELPNSAIDYGADIVVHSSHKSLPVLTQSSMLHLNSSRVDIKKLKYMLKLHQTSSPSYLLLSSLDIGMSILEREGKSGMISLLKNIKEVKTQFPYFFDVSDLDGLPFALDVTKLVLVGKKMDVNPMDFEEKIRQNGIQLEFSNENIAVLITTIMNETSDFQYLAKTMEMLKFKCYSGIDNKAYALNAPCVMGINDVFYSAKEYVFLKDSSHRISGDFVIPYPPGIPLLIPGEVITEEFIVTIKRLKANNQKIVGMTNIDFEDLKIEVVIK